MRYVRPRDVVLLGALLLAAPGADAQGLFETHARTVAVAGDPVPPLPGVSYVFPWVNVVPILDDGGGTFFSAALEGTGVTDLNAFAYFYAPPGLSPILVVRGGDPDPSGTMPGVTLDDGAYHGLTGQPRIAGNGTMLFGARLGGPTVTGANDSALYHGTPGAFGVLAREGDAAPGTAGATYVSGFHKPSHALTVLNDDGAAFVAGLIGGDVTGTLNDKAWFYGTPGNVQMLMRKGDLGPGGEVIDLLHPELHVELNAAGVLVHDVRYKYDTGTPPVTWDDDRALWAHGPGFPSFELLREGDPAPVPGTFYGDPEEPWGPKFGSSSLNALVGVLVTTRLVGAVTPGVDDTALIIATIGSEVLVARTGVPAPGAPSATFTSFFDTSYNDQGMVLFAATLEGPNVTNANDTGIWAGMPGALQLVAREGDPLPGGASGTWGHATAFDTLISNASNEVVFTRQVADATNPGSSTWRWHPEHGFRPVLLPGDPLTLVPGAAGLASLYAVEAANGDTRPLSFDDAGNSAHTFSSIDPQTFAFFGAGIVVEGGALAAGQGSISIASGGTETFHLHTGTSYAGDAYVLLGSASGTSPGLPLGDVVLPLNLDAFALFTVEFANAPPFASTVGVLGPTGQATASLTLPAGLPLTPVGLDFAFLVIDTAGVPTASFASNAVRIELTP